MACVYKTKDLLLFDNSVIKEIEDWTAFLAGEDKEQDVKLFKKHARVGRPLGQEGFRKHGKDDRQNFKTPETREKEEEISDVSPE